MRAQDIGQGIGAGGVKGAQVGGLVRKGGAVVAAGSAYLPNPTGVLLGVEVFGPGTATKTTGYTMTVFGYSVLGAGGSVRSELNGSAMRLIPGSGFFPVS